MNPTEKNHNSFRGAGAPQEHAEAAAVAELLAELTSESDELVEPTLTVAEQGQLTALDEAEDDLWEPVLDRVFQQVDAVASEFLTADAIEDRLAEVKQAAAALSRESAAAQQHTCQDEVAASPAHHRAVMRANDHTDRIIGAIDRRPAQHNPSWPSRKGMPHDKSPRQPTTYFASDSVVVTDQYLMLHQRQYAIEELHQLGITRGPCRASFGKASSIGMACMGLMAGSSFGSWPAVSAGFVLGAVVIVVVLLRWSTQRPYELWAQYQGLSVKVYSCSDRHTFARLCRALLLARGEPTEPAAGTNADPRHRMATALCAGLGLGWGWSIPSTDHLPLVATTGLVSGHAAQL